MARAARFALLLAALAGCAKNRAVQLAEELADAVCACPDLACIEEVRRRSVAELARVSDATGYESDDRAIRAAGARLQACQGRLAGRR